MTDKMLLRKNFWNFNDIDTITDVAPRFDNEAKRSFRRWGAQLTNLYFYSKTLENVNNESTTYSQTKHAFIYI